MRDNEFQFHIILDATAGNRIMWLVKDPHDFVFLDIEQELEVKPTMIMDNSFTAFGNGTFSQIFFDPPHTWRNSSSLCLFTVPNTRLFNVRFPKYAAKRAPRYYGWDKVKTKEGLLLHIEKAQREFYRILKDDGLLFLKWCEFSVSLKTILKIFETSWSVLMKIPIKSRMQRSKHQTYWIIMQKRLL